MDVVEEQLKDFDIFENSKRAVEGSDNFWNFIFT